MAEPNPLAILPIKSFEEAKQRLGEALDRTTRRVLAEAMFTDVLIALRRCTLVDVVLVVTSDHGAQRIAAGYGAIVLEDEQQGHNEAAGHGVDRALELGAERVLLVPGDCPLLDAAELDELIDSHPPGRSAVIVPDRHGSGTNALLLAPPDAMAPSFGPGSRQRHERLARAARLDAQTVEVGSLALDVDTPEDLAVLEATLASSRGGAAHTRGMLRQFERIGS
ncbi:MAG: 2-phospho-L-lactate guanylyltransferase [Solirubrobacteraceae bacterium]